MRITIDTHESATGLPGISAPVPSEAIPQDIDGGSAAQVSGIGTAPAAASADGGGPPDWLLAAVGATPADSEAAATSADASSPADHGASLADGGAGPAAAVGTSLR